MRSIAAIVLFALGCTESSGDSTLNNTTPVDDTGTLVCNDALTWDSWAHGFFLNWCTSCHSSTLSEDDRQKAPPGMNFDTYQGVAENAVAIEYRGVTAEPKYLMPPNGGPDLKERELLRLWIECGLLKE